VSFLGLLVSGFFIFNAHPRPYLGETDGLGAPYILVFPTPFMKGWPSGWGRSLLFLSAWASILTGILYLLSGIFTQKFAARKGRSDLEFPLALGVQLIPLEAPTEEDSLT
jgi:hypothetical protein